MYLVRGGLRGPGDSVPADQGGRRPAPGLLLTEPIRGLVDLTALLLAAPALLTAPRGDGHGALVFPSATHLFRGLRTSGTSMSVTPLDLRGARTSVTTSCRRRSARAA